MSDTRFARAACTAWLDRNAVVAVRLPKANASPGMDAAMDAAMEAAMDALSKGSPSGMDAAMVDRMAAVDLSSLAGNTESGTTPVPACEAARMDVLKSLPLDTLMPACDPLVREAARIFDAPISAVSLVDQDRQWFVSQVGLGDTHETSREVAFCAHAIMEDAPMPLVVLDARKDKRFCNNALVTGAPHIRFYCGMPLFIGGMKMGTLCVIDSKPREFSRIDFIRIVNALEQLSKIVARTVCQEPKLPFPLAQQELIPLSSIEVLAPWKTRPAHAVCTLRRGAPYTHNRSL
jgi:hypothetical protein